MKYLALLVFLLFTACATYMPYKTEGEVAAPVVDAVLSSEYLADENAVLEVVKDCYAKRGKKFAACRRNITNNFEALLTERYPGADTTEILEGYRAAEEETTFAETERYMELGLKEEAARFLSALYFFETVHRNAYINHLSAAAYQEHVATVSAHNRSADEANAALRGMFSSTVSLANQISTEDRLRRLENNQRLYPAPCPAARNGGINPPCP